MIFCERQSTDVWYTASLLPSSPRWRLVQNEMKVAFKKNKIFHFRSIRMRIGKQMSDKPLKICSELGLTYQAYQIVMVMRLMWRLKEGWLWWWWGQRGRDGGVGGGTGRPSRWRWDHGDGPDGIPDVRGDLDTEEEEDYHNEADVQINATIPNAGKPRS